jgi:cytoskeletal protein CcmA (bactofilin family)
MTLIRTTPDFPAETSINLVSEGTHIEGKIVFDQISRVHGTLAGNVLAKPGSTLILAETAVVEGNIQADTLMIDGFVRGDIVASTRVVISGSGRVIGNIRTPSLLIDFGAHFEGQCKMPEGASTAGSTPRSS